MHDALIKTNLIILANNSGITCGTQPPCQPQREREREREREMLLPIAIWTLSSSMKCNTITMMVGEWLLTRRRCMLKGCQLAD